jgi:hypothetical protein
VGCDASKVLEPVERILDAPTQPVETLAEAEGLFPVRFGMTGLVPRSSSSSRNSALSYALTPSIRFAGFTLRIRRSAIGQSCASPPVNKMARRRPLASASACIFVLRPPRERPLFRPLPSDALSRAWSRSSVCLWIVRFQQAPGTGFPRRHAAPSAQSDYRSLSGVHTRAGNRTSDSRFSEHARYR